MESLGDLNYSTMKPKPDPRTLMSNSEAEIVVDDPTAPEADSPAVTSVRAIDIAVSLLLIALAATLGYDNIRTGIAWDSTGPQSGYFPFYLSVILAGASLYGLGAALISRKEAGEAFVTRSQLRRVMAVFIPTLLFCLATQFFGPLRRELPVDFRVHANGRSHRAMEVAADSVCLHGHDVRHLRSCVRRHHAERTA